MEPRTLYQNLREETQTVLIGNESVIEILTTSILTGGHVLIEGVPGVAKTTMARAFARATGLDENRVQMTPDTLPADITGTHIYQRQTGEFEIQRGPVFANLVIVDEINRATPKTQSALLESMQENAVTIKGETLGLPIPFIVVATQNPLEMEGTYELPVAQRDRFQFKLTVGPPDEEFALLDRFDDRPDLSPEDISQVVSAEEILAARETVEEVYVDSTVKRYLLDVITATRDSPITEYGASPRGALLFLNAAKARAAIQGREYVIPDDLKALAHSVLNHRLVLNTEANLSDVTTEDVVDDILNEVEPPEITDSTSLKSADEKTLENVTDEERESSEP